MLTIRQPWSPLRSVGPIAAPALLSPTCLALCCACLLTACGDDAPPASVGDDVLAEVGGAGSGDVVAPDADTGAGTGAIALVESPLLTAPFIHIAHRGGGKLRPAHTIEAYANALAVGADMIELDLHATKDGVIVSIHDYTVDDTTDGKGFVKNKTWAELSALDAGYTFTPDGGKTHPYRGKGLKIARLDEVLKTFPKTWYCVEFKQHIPSIIEPVMTLFEAHGAIDRTIFSAFVDATIWDVRKRRPDALTAMAAAELLAFENLAEADYGSYVSPAPFIQPPDELVTAEGVAKADAFGLKVQPWTVNNPTRMKEFIAMGVHGLFTDDPKTLAAILAP